jgi:hypothetical protein
MLLVGGEYRQLTLGSLEGSKTNHESQRSVDRTWCVAAAYAKPCNLLQLCDGVRIAQRVW